MGTTACFNSLDSLGWKSRMAGQELSIFAANDSVFRRRHNCALDTSYGVAPGENVVCHSCNAILISEGKTKGQHKRCLPRSYRPVKNSCLAIERSNIGGSSLEFTNYMPILEDYHESLPTNSHGKGSFIPISTSYDWHLPGSVRSRPFEYFMGVPMFRSVELMRVRVRPLTAMTVRRLHRCHVGDLELQKREMTLIWILRGAAGI